MAGLGNLVRLAPLDLDMLPSHPALDLSVERKRPRRDSQASRAHSTTTGAPQKASQVVNESEPSSIDVNGRPNIAPFIKEVLDQAVTFIDEILPSTFKSRSAKSAAPATAKVQLLRREVTPSELAEINWLDSKIPRYAPNDLGKTGEAWFCRKSRHANRQEKGTAKLSEFDYGLRVSHSEHEGEYTPDIFDTYKVLDWAVEGDPTEEESNFANYRHITMSSKSGNTQMQMYGVLKDQFMKCATSYPSHCRQEYFQSSFLQPRQGPMTSSSFRYLLILRLFQKPSTAMAAT